MSEVLNLKEYKLSLTEQIVEDLISFKQTKGFESDRKLRDYFTKNSRVNGRSITRIINGETTLPSVDTVFHIYSTLLETSEYTEILKRAPRVVSNFINSYSHKNTIPKESSELANRYLHENQLAMKLYFQCCGHGIRLTEIQKDHGEAGILEIFRMEKMHIVKIDSESKVKLGSTGLNLSVTNHAEISSFMMKQFYRPSATLKKGSNFISSRWESVSPQAYNEMINVLEEAMSKIEKIVKADDLEKPEYMQTKKFCLTTFIDEIK